MNEAFWIGSAMLVALVAQSWAYYEAGRRARFSLQLRRDAAYEERNLLVRAYADLMRRRGCVVGIKETVIAGWSREWRWAVYIESPRGQLSWHFHETEYPVFEGLPRYEGEWDGHTTDEKYRRLKDCWT